VQKQYSRQINLTACVQDPSELLITRFEDAVQRLENMEKRVEDKLAMAAEVLKKSEELLATVTKIQEQSEKLLDNTLITSTQIPNQMANHWSLQNMMLLEQSQGPLAGPSMVPPPPSFNLVQNPQDTLDLGIIGIQNQGHVNFPNNGAYSNYGPI
jgi:hypothetical protein